LDWILYVMTMPIFLINTVFLGFAGFFCLVPPEYATWTHKCLPDCFQVRFFRLRIWWSVSASNPEHKAGTEGLLKFAPDCVKEDRICVLAALKRSGAVLEYVAKKFQADKDMVLLAVKKNGNSLEHASEELRTDRAVVLEAVRNTATALKFAKPPMNQDHECLKASGLWDPDQTEEYPRKELAILSVKFSLGQKTSAYATEFALAMRMDPYLNKFRAYNPNAWSKSSCSRPNFTNFFHPCRGDTATCGFQETQNLSTMPGGEKKPAQASCWRFAFRWQQQKCKETNGFMIQVQEREGLGDGQKIETVMAEQVGLKTFRVEQRDHIEGDPSKFVEDNFYKVAKAVKAWYDSDCPETEQLTHIFI